MDKLRSIKKQIVERLSNKKTLQTLSKPLSYEEVIRRYEELSAR